jgi:hypothetical protein
MKGLIELLEDECKLERYRPLHFFPGNGCTSGKTNRKQPIAYRRKWYGVNLLQLTKFEGRCKVLVTDESKGYAKVIAQSKSLDQLEAEAIFNKTALALELVINQKALV